MIVYCIDAHFGCSVCNNYELCYKNHFIYNFFKRMDGMALWFPGLNHYPYTSPWGPVTSGLTPTILPLGYSPQPYQTLGTHQTCQAPSWHVWNCLTRNFSLSCSHPQEEMKTGWMLMSMWRFTGRILLGLMVWQLLLCSPHTSIEVEGHLIVLVVVGFELWAAWRLDIFITVNGE